MALDEAPTETQQGAPASTTEATNAKMLNTVVGKLLDAGSASSAAVITALTAIASAITASLIGGSTGTTDNRVLISKGTGGRALEASGVTADTSGNVNLNGGDFTCDDITADVIGATTVNATNGAFSSTLTKGGNSLAIVTQTVCASFTIAFPEDGDLYFILNHQFQWTITQTDTITEVGTATVTGLVVGVALINANSASTSINTVSQSRLITSGQSLGLRLASVSSDCENLCFTFWGTRVLAS